MEATKSADDFIEAIDPGLLTYKDELYMRSVTSTATLKFLRPREVNQMKLPDVYKRLLIDKIISLQSPDTKKQMKDERSPYCQQAAKSQKIDSSSLQTPNVHPPKKLKFSETDTESETFDVGYNDVSSHKVVNDENAAIHTTEKSTTQKSVGYLENEVTRLQEERDTLSLLLAHKKDEQKTMLSSPAPPQPLAIPGNKILKTVCDNCHHKGHKSYGNKGNKSCPFLPCAGYHFCGILNKHREYKQEVGEVERDILNLEKEVKMINEQIKNINVFLSHNATNFIVALKPILKAAFPSKYSGKIGNQLLQKDLRFLKIATGGKIPDDLDTIPRQQLQKLINEGKLKINTKCGLIDDSDVTFESTTSACSGIPITTSQLVNPVSYGIGNLSFTQPQSVHVPPFWAAPSPQTSNVFPNLWYPSGTSQMPAMFNYMPVTPVHGPPSATITSEEVNFQPPLPENSPYQPPMPDIE